MEKKEYHQAQNWLDSNYTTKNKGDEEVVLSFPLKGIPSKYWDKVEVGDDWDQEYSTLLPNTVDLPMMVNLNGYDKRFKSQELLNNFKNYANGEDDFYSWAGTDIRPKIKDIPSDYFGSGESDWNKWYSVSYYSTEKKLTQYLRDANKLFVKDGYGQVMSQEAFEFLKSIVGSSKIKANVKLTKDDEFIPNGEGFSR